MKLGIQDTLHQIDKDVKLLKSCYLWNDPSTNYCSLSDHQTQHAHPISIDNGAPCLNQELTAVAIPHYYPKTQQFHCDICGYRLNTPSQLSEHIMCVHDVTGSFQSNICNNAGLRESDPNSHMIEHAQQEPYYVTEQEHNAITPALVHCAFCDNTFTDMRELNVHTAGAHGDMLAPHDAGVETDHSIGIDPHSPVHANHEYEEEIFIPQVDGVVDMPVDKFQSIATRQVMFSNTTVPPDTPQNHLQTSQGQPSAIRAPYTLNNTKQISTLAKHAWIADFNIDITSDHNINIQCSAGFYAAVPKPGLTIIKEGHQVTLDGVLVRCTESRPKKDQLGRNDNHVLRFKVGHDDQGNAVLHLHHTQQLVQVQGSACRWFVDHFLKHVFISEARDKDVVISNLNKIFANAGKVQNKKADNRGQLEPKSCSYCHVKFRSNSKPSSCGNCTGYFHNSKQNKCFTSHTCQHDYIASVSSSSSVVSTAFSTTVSPSISHVSGSPTSQQSCSAMGSSFSGSRVSASIMPNQVIPAVSLPAARQLVITVPSSLSASTTSQATGTIVTSTPSSQVPSCSTLLNPTGAALSSKSRKKTPASQEKSLQDAETALLKQELIIAKTKMIQLESSKKDLERKNTVLVDTIKIYESEQNKILRQKYFSDHSSPEASANFSSASAPHISADAGNSSSLSFKTLDRLINYFLDVVHQVPKSQTMSSTSSSVPSFDGSPVSLNLSASTTSHGIKSSSETANLSCSPEPPEILSEPTAVLTSPSALAASPTVILSETNTIEGEINKQLVCDIEDFDFDNDGLTSANDNTIDEFMDVGDNVAPPANHLPLNYQPLTTQ